MSLDDVVAARVEEAVAKAMRPVLLELERIRSGPVLVSIEEAARRLGVTPRTVQRWVKRNEIETELVGTLRMVRLPAGVEPG